MNINENNLPQLIVGLDSLGNDANYVHITDIRENTNYFCPCCKRSIKPRAYKKDTDYQVQPHFFHENGGCSEETFVHYICKNWLFEKGCKFIVNSVQYEVANIEIEKTLHTSFGDYRPDIIVMTTVNKIFYFEIKTANKKSELYAPKWDELGNDVVEVDTRYFINQKYNNNIPEFNLIYSEGKCFIKNYSMTDYDSIIEKRKIEWKRQDRLNYKIQWERLDWFWIDIQHYIDGKATVERVLESFNQLDYSDKLWCYYTIKRKSCVDLKEPFKKNINQHFFNMIETLYDERINISLKQVSPKVYEVHFHSKFLYLDYKLFEEEIVRIKIQRGDILSLDYKTEIYDAFSRMKERIKQCDDVIKRIKYIASLPFIKSIVPCSHWAARNYTFRDLNFDIEFEDNIHNKYVKEFIGKEYNIPSTKIFEPYVKHLYYKFKKDALTNLENEYMTFALKTDTLYLNTIDELRCLCNEIDYLQIRVSDDYRQIVLMSGDTHIFQYEYKKEDLFGIFEEEMKNSFVTHINKQIDKHKKIATYVDMVNNCKNHLWSANYYGNVVTLKLFDPVTNQRIHFNNIYINSTNDIKNCILTGMRELFDWAENYKGIRFLEG